MSSAISIEESNIQDAFAKTITPFYDTVKLQKVFISDKNYNTYKVF